MIDSHLHVWDPSRLNYPWLKHVPAIAGRRGPEHWPQAAGGVRRAVFVQADCVPAQALDEIDWVSGLDFGALDVAAGVAFAPLERGHGVEPHLEALRRRPFVRGVRRSIQNETDGFAVAPDHLQGMVLAARAGFSLDVCARGRQAPEVLASLRRLFDQAPEARVVLNHLGKPDIAANGADIHAQGWAEYIRALADLPQVRVKLSGLTTQLAWNDPADDALFPYIDHAIQTLGPRRCMFGGDWPVAELATGGYRRWLDVVERAVAPLTPEEQRQILADCAAETYRLNDTGETPS